MNPTRTWAATALLAFALTACGGSATSPDATTDAGAPSPSADTAADAFGITDPWVKAAGADDGMTAVFGEITNSSDTEVTIVAASHDAADTVELHEVVTEGTDGTMREKDGGFVVPAGGGLPLEPGADHIMLMDLTRDLEPGDETTVAVEFSDGSTAEFTAPVKEYAGADEEYGGDGHEGHGDGDH